MSYKFILACVLITAGQVFSWYGTYSPFIWKWAKDNMHFLPLIFSIPTGYLFLYGMRFAIEEMGNTWRHLIVTGKHLTSSCATFFYTYY